MFEIRLVAGVLALFAAVVPRLSVRLKVRTASLDHPFGRRDGRLRWRRRVPARILMFPPEVEADETITMVDPVADAA